MAKDAYEKALSLIRQNETVVIKIAEYLIKNETMNAEELDELMDEKKKIAII